MKHSIYLAVILAWAVLLEPSASEFVRVCYHQSWADYRINEAKFQISDIDPFLCTHLVFAFANIDAINNKLVAFDSRDEGDNGRFSQFNNLKGTNPALKTLLSVGGESAPSASFIAITSSDSRLRQFSSACVRYLREWNFDGFDLDWEFPAGNGEKQMFTKLVKALREAFNSDIDSPKLLLTFAGSAGKWTIDAAYEIQEVAKYVDYVFIMSYDYHVARVELLTFNSPLYAHPTGRFEPTLNTNWTVHYYHELGMPYNKMVVGFTGVGRRHVLNDTTKTDVGSATTKAVMRSTIYNLLAGLAYPEICDFLSRPNTTRKFYEPQKNPYCYNGEDWVGYEDKESLSYKIPWMLGLEVAGIMFWALDYDDFTGRHCREGRYPLLNYVKNMTQAVTAPTTSPLATTSPPPTTTQPNVPPMKFQRACFFQSWARWRTTAAKFDVQDIDPNMCTHLIYAFGKLDTNTRQLVAADPAQEEGISGTFRKFNDLKLKNAALMTLLSIGGAGITREAVLSISSSEAGLRDFCSSVVGFLRARGFDGLDVDWQYPASASKYLFINLLRSLRAAFNADTVNPKLLLTIAGPAGQSTIAAGYNVPEIAKYVDYVYLLTYDYFSTTSNMATFNSPLYSPLDQMFDARFNINWTVHYWNSLGLPYHKVVVGLTGLGRRLALKDPNNFRPGSDTTSEIRTGPLYQLSSQVAYPEVCELLTNQSTKRYFDNVQTSSYLVKGDDWVGYEAKASLDIKLQWMLDVKVGGMVFWALDYDDFSGKMCKAGNYPLLNRVALKTSPGYTTSPPEKTTPGNSCPTPHAYIFYIATLLTCLSICLLNS